MKILYLPNAYSQQRQTFDKVNIYPVLMAMEAEWYKKQGHRVWWGEQSVPFLPFSFASLGLKLMMKGKVSPERPKLFGEGRFDTMFGKAKDLEAKS